MPTATPEALDARTRRVKTITEETVPADSGRRGLGKPWKQWLAELTPEEWAITTVYGYRYEPRNEGFIFKVSGVDMSVKSPFFNGAKPFQGPLDEEWISSYFGGGTYGVAIDCKNGASNFDKNVIVAGPPRLLPPAAEAAAQPGAPGAAGGISADTVNRLCDLIERMQERLDGGSRRNPAAEDSAIDVMATAAKRAVDVVSNAGAPGAAADPLASLERAIGLLKMAGVFGNGAHSLDSDLDRLVKLKSLMGGGGIGEFLTAIPTIMEAAEKLGFKRGDGPSDWKGEIAQGVMQNLPDILDTVRTAVTANAATPRERAAAAARSRQLPPAPNAGAAAPQATPRQPYPANAGPAPASGFTMRPIDDSGEAPAAAGGESEGPMPFTETPEFVLHVKETIVGMVERGDDGAAVVEFLRLNRQGKMCGLLVQYPPEVVTQFLSKDPVLARAVANENWADVLKEAREYILHPEAEPGPDSPPRPN